MARYDVLQSAGSEPRIEVYYRPVMSLESEIEFVGFARTMTGAKEMAEEHCRQNKNSPSGYVWKRAQRGPLFTYAECRELRKERGD